MMSSVKNAFEYAAELIFPPRCVLCGKIRRIGSRFCERCAADADELRLVGDERDCDDGERIYTHIDGVCASFEYSGAAADAVAQLKFHGASYLAREMARFIAADVENFFCTVDFDIAVAVPSYRRKNRHADILAKSTASLLGLRFLQNEIVKTRRTEKQHSLDAERRKTNLIGAFSVKKPEAVAGRVVLIIDDVTTGGSTLNECAAALKAAGAREVYGAVFCATPKLYA